MAFTVCVGVGEGSIQVNKKHSMFLEGVRRLIAIWIHIINYYLNQ